MPRQARQQSNSMIYHVMLRGNEQKNIFLDDSDKIRFLDTLSRMKENGEYAVLAYCLMNNHVHLLVKEGTDSLQRSLKRISVSYVYYFNKKYKRIGHLFQDRYKSEAVENDPYIMAAVRYIHNNPVKAGITNIVEDYRWSSFRSYVDPEHKESSLVDSNFILSLFSDNKSVAVNLFKEFSADCDSDTFIDCKDEAGKLSPNKTPTEDIMASIDKLLNTKGYNRKSLRECKNKLLRNNLLREIKGMVDISIRDLSKVLGISKDIIFRA